MAKYYTLKYCPRVKTAGETRWWRLKKPTARCRFLDQNLPGGTNPNECHCWTAKGLRKYCEDEGIKVEIGTRLTCVLFSGGD
jgi:hypothetical protein